VWGILDNGTMIPIFHTEINIRLEQTETAALSFVIHAIHMLQT
jgi:hypothetical protein